MPTTYEIMPPVDFVRTIIGTGVVLPDWTVGRLMTGVPQRKQIVPVRMFAPLWTGAAIPTGRQVLIHGVPGTTTGDGGFPDDTKPQFRLQTVLPPTVIVALYHGEPGVLRGDDNWSQSNPSIRPQLRTNTLPHTTDPTLVEGTWKPNEVFLPPAPD